MSATGALIFQLASLFGKIEFSSEFLKNHFMIFWHFINMDLLFKFHFFNQFVHLN